MSTAGRVLIVDDNNTNLAVLGEILERHGYEILVANSGEMAVAVATHQTPDVVLLDVMMPGGMNGFDTCRALRSHASLHNVPVLFLSADSAVQAKVDGFQAGGVDYVSKPFQTDELLARLNTHIELHRLRNKLQQEVDRQTAAVQSLYVQLESSYEQALQLLSLAGEFRDRDTGNHTRRIGLYARMLAEAHGQSVSFCHQIELAAPLHDVGKIGIPDSILLKEGPLSPEEWAVMRSHAEIGASLLRRYQQPLFDMAAEIAACHHERCDGSGYPRGLRGEAIPLAARITTLVDTYDALRAKRPYKNEYSHEQALQVLQHGDGRTQPQHFDQELVRCLISKEKEMAQIYAADAIRHEAQA